MPYSVPAVGDTASLHGVIDQIDQLTANWLTVHQASMASLNANWGDVINVDNGWGVYAPQRIISNAIAASLQTSLYSLITSSNPGLLLDGPNLYSYCNMRLNMLSCFRTVTFRRFANPDKTNQTREETFKLFLLPYFATQNTDLGTPSTVLSITKLGQIATQYNALETANAPPVVGFDCEYWPFYQ